MHEYSIDIPLELVPGTWPWGPLQAPGPHETSRPTSWSQVVFWAQNGVCGIWCSRKNQRILQMILYQIPYTTYQNMRESWYSMICSLLLYHHYISLYNYSLVVCSWYLKKYDKNHQKPTSKGRSLCRTLFDGHLGVYHIFNSDEGS